MTAPAPVPIASFSTADAVAIVNVHVPGDVVHTPEQLAAWGMFRALGNVPCVCQHNVPYSSSQVSQFVTQPCGRCKAMAAWFELQPHAHITLSSKAEAGATP